MQYVYAQFYYGVITMTFSNLSKFPEGHTIFHILK